MTEYRYSNLLNYNFVDLAHFPKVYLYTFTGLHDKPGNHLTQFMGVLLRPLDTLPQSAVQTEKPRKRVVMSLE